mmetsp:Transcript_35836/g.40943  ORF Transcript_35836/g.40943 Transcript_35836/m.40943 type:complete len:110 (-) Transcript_35836:167-496(-)
MRNNDIHFSCGSTDDVYCDGCNNLDTSDQFGKEIDIQVVRNNNSFSDYDDDFGNDSNDNHGLTINFESACKIRVRNDVCQMDNHNDNKDYLSDTDDTHFDYGSIFGILF